jgi:hypothetical protein
MKQKWIVNRQIAQQMDGQRRWDLAYQCLLRWAQAASHEEASTQAQQEVYHESSNLCSGVDAKTSPSSDH